MPQQGNKSHYLHKNIFDNGRPLLTIKTVSVR